MKKWLKKDIFWIFLILGISLLPARYLFAPGFYTFSDENHLANLYEMIRAIAGGQFPPRWAPDVSFNFGYPLFNFYYPLPFYLGAIFHLVFKTNLVWSLKLVFLFSLPASAVAFYFLMRKFFSQLTSFSGAILYTFTPYRAVDLYVRGAVGEMWGFVLMPLVLLSFVNLIEKKTLFNLILAGLSLAGLILVHNLTPIIFLPFLVILVLVLAKQNREKFSSLFWYLSAVVLGLAASAYYWLPATLEKRFIQPGTPYNPYDHFPFIKQLIFPSWGYGASVWGPGDQMSFQIGIVNLLVIIFAIFTFIFLRKTWEGKKITLFLCCLLFVVCSLFLMNIRSWFLWRLIPLGDYLQFPWRFLILTTFFTSLLIGFSENLLGKKRTGYLPLVFAFLALILTWNYFKPGKIVQVDDDYYLRRFFADRTVSGKREIPSAEYLNYSEDYLPLTIWAKKRPNRLPETKALVYDSRVKIQTEEITPTRYQIEIETPGITLVEFNNYYFPGWRAEIDGRQAPIRIGNPYGQILIDVPEGKHLVSVFFSESSIRKIADMISLVGFGTVLALFVLKYPHGSKGRNGGNRSRTRQKKSS